MQTNFWRNFDWILFGTVGVLIVFGILMIRSATLGAIDPDLINRVPDQIRYALIGVGVMLALAAIDYRMLGGIHLWLYLIMVILLILVLFLGVEGEAGAQRWINVGIQIQPSEIGKILIIITLATYLAKRYQQIDQLPVIGGSIIHLAIPVGLIFIQPNLGTTIVFGVIWAALMWGAGLRIKHIFLGVAIILVTMPLLWSQMERYQRDRITTFLFPNEQDRDTFYNIEQSQISVGSGGWFGKGYASGTQNTLRFLRVRHTDFIFSVIAEEFGFIGGVAVMGLLGVVIVRILRGARLATDPLGALICYGVAAMIFFQTFVSIGMNLRLLPVTGLVLPFVSSGGTSLLSMMAGIGLAQSVLVHRRKF
ncbi:MAG: rod shape-determining protein RodA [Anaerolineae bacterium]|jgi:rod shape determining protein RodA|nr:rod shape-determining protein RodA [Anaerolineae bacterium]